MTQVRVDLGDLVKDWAAARAILTQTTRTAVHGIGALALTTIRAKSSTGNHSPRTGHIPGTGPGPNVVTGDYRRSQTLTTPRVPGTAGGSASSALVSSNAVQAMRLEKGFVGVDSLGRHYFQAPFPHWEPMGDEMEPKFEDAMNGVIDAVADKLEGNL